MDRDREKLSDLVGIREMSLSASMMSEGEESILSLGNKPKHLEDQDLTLRYDAERSDLPEAFYVSKGTILDTRRNPDTEFAINGWTYTAVKDLDENKTTKDYYLHIENKRTHKEYFSIPITKNHFDPGRDVSLDDLLVVDKQTFEDNPNFSLRLNHKKIQIEAVDGKWVIDKSDPLADRIKLPGNTIEVNNPEEGNQGRIGAKTSF